MPIPETRISLRGFQKIELTTAAHLFNPEEAFAIAHEMNGSVNGFEEKRIGLELYPTRSHPLLEKAKSAGEKASGKIISIVNGITYDRVANWREKYPQADLERVHIEFWASRREQAEILTQIPFREWPSHLALAVYLGPAQSLYGIKLAEQLNLGVNIHGNVVEPLKNNGLLPGKNTGVKYVLGENGLANSPFASISNAHRPEVILSQIKRHDLDGMLLGADHLRELGEDPSDYLTPEILKVLRAVHIAEAGHAEVMPGNKVYERFVRKLANSEHPHPVSLVFDSNPINMKDWSYERKLRYYKDTAEWLWDVQNDELAKAA